MARVGAVAELTLYTATGLALRLAELAERMADGEEYLEEEARRLLAELTNRVTAPPPTQWGGRVQPALISKMVETLSEAAGKLALASEFLAGRRYKRLAQAARELAKVAPFVDMLHQGPLAAQAAQAPALTLPATDVARECGGLAARVLREIAARPGASEWELLSWASANGFSAEALNAALQCLLRKGLVEVEAGPRGLTYRLSPAPR